MSFPMPAVAAKLVQEMQQKQDMTLSLPNVRAKVFNRKPQNSSAKLSPSQLKELERVCNNRMLWSDGGYWQGVGPEPDCFAKEEESNEQIAELIFTTERAAEAWNNAEERALRGISYLAGAATGGATAALSTTKQIAVGLGSAVVAGESLSLLESNFQKGHSLIYRSVFKMEYSVHPWGTKTFTVEFSYQHRDSSGNVVRKAGTTRRFNLNSSDSLVSGAGTNPFPLSYARILAGKESMHIVIKYE